MRYAVLGTGTAGRTLAAALSSLGHEVVIGTRDPETTLARTEPDAMGNAPFAQWAVNHPLIRLQTFGDAAAHGERILNATAGAASLSALEAAGARQLNGKILLDVANPLDFTHGMPPTLDPVNTDSLGERIQRTFPGARVVKTLNTMNSAVMTEPARVPGEHHVFVSGDDADAKAAAVELLVAFGWPRDGVIDLGDISTARGPEMLLPMWLRLWGALGHTDFNFHIQGARARG
ncbi:NAD(P)-binding domain-containing protein [Streptomyces sp. HNM0663]|uniref:NAD(P)-binding domain-containing protein n=1 Tax=Streptomyces chengmaiensis TaxID=3040919 RepID=A0ABT6HUY5_9ACTN|nr:NAD(P)-binding domain-containing protein [Streptomyces chengmaiensis]MDH2392516.1 NAD(P)-binding domain-containing protein [Streptomyces chengmaiensis]